MASVATAVMSRLDLHVRKAPQDRALCQSLQENVVIVAEGALDRHAVSPQQAGARLYKCDHHNGIDCNCVFLAIYTHHTSYPKSRNKDWRPLAKGFADEIENPSTR